MSQSVQLYRMVERDGDITASPYECVGMIPPLDCILYENHDKVVYRDEPVEGPGTFYDGYRFIGDTEWKSLPWAMVVGFNPLEFPLTGVQIEFTVLEKDNGV